MEIWEESSFIARYFTRLMSGYSFEYPLFEVSRRDSREKSMFLIKDSQKKEHVLSLVLFHYYLPLLFPLVMSFIDNSTFSTTGEQIVLSRT